VFSQLSHGICTSLLDIPIAVLEHCNDLRNNILDHIMEWGWKYTSVLLKPTISTVTYIAQPVFPWHLCQLIGYLNCCPWTTQLSDWQHPWLCHRMRLETDLSPIKEHHKHSYWQCSASFPTAFATANRTFESLSLSNLIIWGTATSITSWNGAINKP
jgi:hypothetical protein